MDAKRLLDSIGKEIFINYFYDFKNCKDKSKLAQKLLEENPKATKIGGQVTRINCAVRIINDKNTLIESLNLVINSNRLSNEIINKAHNIKLKELEMV